MANTFQSILHDLRAGRFAPIYLFDGEEPYFIDQLTHYIEEHALDEAGKAFDQVVLYGKETDVLVVVDEIKRFPMIGDRRVVIVKEAQQLKKIEDLLGYVKNPLQQNILVLAHSHKKMDGKKAITKYLRQHAVYFESKKLYDNQVPGWIEEHFKSFGYHIGLKAAALLAEYVGSDLSRLHNEIEKLRIVIPASSEITPEDIERNIGISKDYNNFELVAALAHKDILKANKIIKYFDENPKEHPIMATISVLYNYFTKVMLVHVANTNDSGRLATILRVHPFFVKDYQIGARNYTLNKLVRIIHYLREADMRSKGVNNTSTSTYDLLRELLFKILH
jgi:DNA polymerase-3 subunit delta